MTRPLLFYIRRIVIFLTGLCGLLLISVMILFFVVSGLPELHDLPSNSVNDITGLNPIHVAHVSAPTSEAELAGLIRSHKGKISVGGARHSMGGQIGSDSSLHLDMRRLNEVISFSKADRQITVQAGITWRQIQEYIDPHGLSVMIMQTYADFTVGGSLSVNVHGRYVGHGPIIHSLISMRLVLADGTVVNASRDENPELFYGCIGGYGGLGVIAEATLLLEENAKVGRTSETMALAEYAPFFLNGVRGDATVIFHNADIYPDDYSRVRAVSYRKTEAALTENERLIPLNRDYRMERFAMWMVSEFPGGKWLRENWADPLYYSKSKVCWRNYEASYNALELEPKSRAASTYVLQEYFIPVRNFDSFVPKMANVLKSHKANVINVSIRHAKADTLSLLSWAPEEVFCFVIYYKQGTDEEARREVGLWTRELVDCALNEQGSFYLPYQLHATPTQFRQAYPHAEEYFALKKRLDPDNRFSNRLLEKYGGT